MAITSSRPSSGRAIGAMRMPPPNVVPLQIATAWLSSTRSPSRPSGSDGAAAQPHAVAHGDAAQGGLGVGDAAAQDGG